MDAGGGVAAMAVSLSGRIAGAALDAAMRRLGASAVTRAHFLRWSFPI